MATSEKGAERSSSAKSGSPKIGNIFRSKSAKEAFEKVFSTKDPVPPRNINNRFVESLGYDCFKLMRKVGLSGLIDLDEPIYPTLMREFYSNLIFEEGTLNGDFYLRGRQMKLTEFTLGTFLNAEKPRKDSVRVFEKIKYPGYEKKEAIKLLTGLSGKKITVYDLPNNDRLMNHGLIQLIMPRKHKTNDPTNRDIFYLWCIKTGLHIDVSFLVLSFMKEFTVGKLVEMPYGMLITRIAIGLGIDLSKEQDKMEVNAGGYDYMLLKNLNLIPEGTESRKRDKEDTETYKRKKEDTPSKEMRKKKIEDKETPKKKMKISEEIKEIAAPATSRQSVRISKKKAAGASEEEEVVLDISGDEVEAPEEGRKIEEEDSQDETDTEEEGSDEEAPGSEDEKEEEAPEDHSEETEETVNEESKETAGSGDQNPETGTAAEETEHMQDVDPIDENQSEPAAAKITIQEATDKHPMDTKTPDPEIPESSGTNKVKKEFLDFTFSAFIPPATEEVTPPESQESETARQLSILSERMAEHTSAIKEQTSAIKEITEHLKMLEGRFTAKEASDAEQLQIIKNMISYFYTSMAKSAYVEKEKKMPAGITEEEKMARRKEAFDEIDEALPTTLPKPSPSSDKPSSSTIILHQNQP